MHRHVDQLPGRIVNADFRETTITRLLCRIPFGTRRGGSTQRVVHILDLKPEMIDAFALSARRQHCHVDIAIGEIDRAFAVLTDRTAPCFGHSESFLVEIRGLFLILHLQGDMSDFSHGILPVYLYNFSAKPVFWSSSRNVVFTKAAVVTDFAAPIWSSSARSASS